MSLIIVNILFIGLSITGFVFAGLNPQNVQLFWTLIGLGIGYIVICLIGDFVYLMGG